MRKSILGLGLVSMLALGACTTAQTTTVTADLSTAQATAEKIIVGYDNAKVIATALVVLYPQYATQVGAVEAIADPIVAQLTPLVTDASADAATIESLLNQLQTQVNDLTAAVKPAATAAAKRG